MVDIDALGLHIKDWADKTFPERNDTSMFLKMYGEIAEMIEAPDETVGDEVADVLIMLLDFAKRRKINIGHAVLKKMCINRQRAWQRNPSGSFSHVKVS